MADDRHFLKFPLTRMRTSNDGVESKDSSFWGVLFLMLGSKMIIRGIYKIKDQFFDDFPDPYLKTNKEENRPCYFCFVEESTGLFWMIPMYKREQHYHRKNKTY